MTTDIKQSTLLVLPFMNLRRWSRNLASPISAQQLFEGITGKGWSLRSRFQLCRRISANAVEKGLAVGHPAIDKKFVSVDGTVRYLMTFPDGESVETSGCRRRCRRSGRRQRAGNELEKQTSRTWIAQLFAFPVRLLAVIASFGLTGLLGVKRNLPPAKSWDRLPPS